MRAEITALTSLKRDGHVVFQPRLKPFVAWKMVDRFDVPPIRNEVILFQSLC